MKNLFKPWTEIKSQAGFWICLALIVSGAGCAALDKALLTSQTSVTPASTNALTGVITPPATNHSDYAPNPLAQAGVQAVGALPFPGSGIAAIAGGWLLTAYAAYRNRKLNVALVTGIEAGRQILQQTPEGQKLDAKVKDVLIQHQELAGVLNAAGKLVNNLTTDTVKPAA